MIDVTGTIACVLHNYLNYTVTVTPPACSPFVAEAPWVSSRETKENVFWQTVLAKRGVFCHRRDNHSHLYKNIGVARRSE